MTRRVVITGVDGFLGWHLRCRLRALTDDDIVGLGRSGLADQEASAAAVSGAAVVFHVAGVNRGTDDELVTGNQLAAEQVVDACDRAGSTPRLVYANSIHRDRDTVYGKSKRQAGELLESWSATRDTSYADVRLPNLFGEHARPHYNSVVATFCHLLATGGSPEVTSDAEIPLLHAQDAASALLAAAEPLSPDVIEPPGRPTRVTAVRDLLEDQVECYRDGEIPDLADPFARDLFNTYRSYALPSFPLPITKHSDDRGSLFECVRAHGGTGQTFLSTSRPGVTRGEHFHLHKVERFVVVAGQGQIRLRRMFSDEVVRFDVNGDTPVIVDMPTMWAHSVTNTGDDDMVTLFWTDDLFDPERPDTYAEAVLHERELAVS
ncbi:MAG: SDR family oxidoreductase [Nocardioidaceae bacterium]|nr:SDR family oxidoreductase [Nocardioidaceae bacterium]